MRRLESLAADSTTLQAYLREIAKFPRLTLDQERDLTRRIRERADEHARAVLVEGHLRFVVSYVKRYRNRGVPLLDLIHEGNLGLIEAARRFEPETNGAFITYAMWWVRQSMVHVIAESARAADQPTMSRAGGGPVIPWRAAVEHSPAPQAVLDELDDIDLDGEPLVWPALGDDSLSDRAWVHGSGAEGVARGEILPDPSTQEIDDDVTRDALVNDLEVAMSELDPKERQVMRLRYGLYDDELWTVQQIGERMKLPRERIRQLESRAMQKLRRRKNLRSYLN